MDLRLWVYVSRMEEARDREPLVVLAGGGHPRLGDALERVPVELVEEKPEFPIVVCGVVVVIRFPRDVHGAARSCLMDSGLSIMQRVGPYGYF
jgi:hypothetical protein